MNTNNSQWNNIEIDECVLVRFANDPSILKPAFFSHVIKNEAGIFIPNVFENGTSWNFSKKLPVIECRKATEEEIMTLFINKKIT